MAADLLTPKDLADAIGASESSVRRWLDAGTVKVTRTAGGHRRIALEEAVRFIRASGQQVVRPEILGVHGLRRRTATPREEEGADQLFEILRQGRSGAARALVTGWYLAGRPLADMFDGPVRLAMHRIGELWRHEPEGILQEHAASVACVEAVVALRELMPRPGPAAPLAIGGAPAEDFYQLPTLMAGTILRSAGYRTRNYGPNTPLPLLGVTARVEGARIVWVSISADVGKSFRGQLAQLGRGLTKTGAELVVGGSTAEAHVPVAANIRHMASMAELAAFAASRSRQV